MELVGGGASGGLMAKVVDVPPCDSLASLGGGPQPIEALHPHQE